MATSEPEGAAAPGDGRSGPESGGCLNLGWGCLPVVALLIFAPTGLFF